MNKITNNNKNVLKIIEEEYGKDSDEYIKLKKVLLDGQKRSEELYDQNSVTYTGSLDSNKIIK